MRINRVRQNFKEGRPSFGIYVSSASTDMIEFLAKAGLDYVRIDMDGSSKNPETIHNMINTAHAFGITPFVRVPIPLDEGTVDRVLKMGALGIIVPRVTSRADVEEAVRVVKARPYGERHLAEDELEWAAENIILSVQVETREGVEAIDDIVSIEGLDMVQSGRGDLSYSYGVPGQQYHPTVLAGERAMVEAGIRAGKIVSTQYYPLRHPEHVQTVLDWKKEGVHCLNLGGDGDIVYVFQRLLEELKA